MKLLSFGPHGQERPGLLVDDTFILDLTQTLPRHPQSMRELLERGLLDSMPGPGAVDRSQCIPLESTRIAPPVVDPTKILCLGLNYRDHAEEQNKPLPKKPLVFAKVTSALIGPGEAIRLPDPEFETFTDPEAEMAVVIGREASQVPEDKAYDHVAGYTILNDVSGRDTQNSEKQWTRAKGYDTFAPAGLWIVTRDEIADPHTLDISCRVNGELRQKSNTSNLIFTVPFLVSYLSRTMTLHPGDLISTGTPGGVGIYRDPPVRLEEGDRVSVEISGIGLLENHVEGR